MKRRLETGSSDVVGRRRHADRRASVSARRSANWCRTFMQGRSGNSPRETAGRSSPLGERTFAHRRPPAQPGQALARTPQNRSDWSNAITPPRLGLGARGEEHRAARGVEHPPAARASTAAARERGVVFRRSPTSRGCRAACHQRVVDAGAPVVRCAARDPSEHR